MTLGSLRRTRRRLGMAALGMVLMVIAMLLMMVFAMATISLMPMRMASQHVLSMEARDLAESVLEEFRFQYLSQEQVAIELGGFCLTKPPNTTFNIKGFTAGSIFPTPLLTGTEGTVDIHWGKSADPYYSIDNSVTNATVMGWVDNQMKSKPSGYKGSIPPYSVDLIINVTNRGVTTHYEALMTQLWPYAVFSLTGMDLLGGTVVNGEAATAVACGTGTPKPIVVGPEKDLPIGKGCCCLVCYCPSLHFCKWQPRIAAGSTGGLAAAVIWPTAELAKKIKQHKTKACLGCKYVYVCCHGTHLSGASATGSCGCICPLPPNSVQVLPLGTNSHLINSKGAMAINYKTCGYKKQCLNHAVCVKYIRGWCDGCPQTCATLGTYLKNCGPWVCKVWYIKCGLTVKCGNWKTCGSVVNYQPRYPKCNGNRAWSQKLACDLSCPPASCPCEKPWSPEALAQCCPKLCMTGCPYPCCKCPQDKCCYQYRWQYAGKTLRLVNAQYYINGNLDLVSKGGASTVSACCGGCKPPTLYGCNATLVVRGALRISDGQIGAGNNGLLIVANDISIEGGGCLVGSILALKDLRVSPRKPHNILHVHGGIVARGSGRRNAHQMVSFCCPINLASTCITYRPDMVSAFNCLDELYLKTWRQLP